MTPVCLLALINVDLDPDSQMNVWLRSAANHQWNLNQKTPATPREAEIDGRMRAPASTIDPGKRKALLGPGDRLGPGSHALPRKYERPDGGLTGIS
jgi:hypothetical protein